MLFCNDEKKLENVTGAIAMPVVVLPSAVFSKAFGLFYSQVQIPHFSPFSLCCLQISQNVRPDRVGLEPNYSFLSGEYANSRIQTLPQLFDNAIGWGTRISSNLRIRTFCCMRNNTIWEILLPTCQMWHNPLWCRSCCKLMS